MMLTEVHQPSTEKAKLKSFLLFMDIRPSRPSSAFPHKHDAHLNHSQQALGDDKHCRLTFPVRHICPAPVVYGLQLSYLRLIDQSKLYPPASDRRTWEAGEVPCICSFFMQWRVLTVDSSIRK